MKFGKRLNQQIQESLPGWRDKFLSYKNLKQLVKLISSTLPLLNGSLEYVRAEAEFVYSLNNEIDKFNAFFMEQEEDFVIKHKHAARYLANQEWVKNDSLKTVENTAIPIIMLVVEVPHDLISSAVSNVHSPKEESAPTTGEHVTNIHSYIVGLEDSASPTCSHLNQDNKRVVTSVRLDISFKSPSHTGLQTTELVKELTEQFPASAPLALVLKQFLADRSLDQSYSGGLSSYCLVLLITRFLQHEHHLGRPTNQNYGSLLMDFLDFFRNVFDPRQMRISVQGSGLYIKRERGQSINPIHIDEALFPTNNVGRNCFRMHQCIKAFAEAYAILENKLTCLPSNGDSCLRPPLKFLPKIIPGVNRS